MHNTVPNEKQDNINYKQCYKFVQNFFKRENCHVPSVKGCAGVKAQVHTVRGLCNNMRALLEKSCKQERRLRGKRKSFKECREGREGWERVEARRGGGYPHPPCSLGHGPTLDGDIWMAINDPWVPDFKEFVLSIGENAGQLFIHKNAIYLGFDHREVGEFFFHAPAIANLEAYRTKWRSLNWFLVTPCILYIKYGNIKYGGDLSWSDIL